MANIFHMDGMFVFILLMVCTCAYFKRVPRLKAFFLSEKQGFFGTLYKGAVIGVRLHWLVSLACVASGSYLILFK